MYLGEQGTCPVFNEIQAGGCNRVLRKGRRLSLCGSYAGGGMTTVGGGLCS